jgi:hypothetical protein
MLINETKLVEIFIELDDFCQKYSSWQQHREFPCPVVAALKPGVKAALSDSEILTILILYHLSGYKCFEYFYTDGIQNNLRREFPKAVSYTRFVALIPQVAPLMLLFTQYKCAQSARTGTYFVDSKTIDVCHIKREHQHRVFKDIATKGKSSMGWFFGLKLHLVINDIGEIVQFAFSSAKIADNNALILNNLFANLTGKCVGDKGYLTKLFDSFLDKGLQIITKIRRNMKNVLMPLADKIILRKRGIIESVNDILMTVCDVEHSRHRSPDNAFVSMMAALSAYAFLERKPSLKFKNWIG